MDTNQLLQIKDVSKSFEKKHNFRNDQSHQTRAVNNVSFTVYRGETLSIVGQSGSGKTTLVKMILRLYKPCSGSILYSGKEIFTIARKQYSKKVQVVFQDPFSSLNPVMHVETIISEPLIIHNIGARAMRLKRTKILMKDVGLDESLLRRRPHQLSGGQRQRVAIARALAIDPELLICDEPVSSLDSSNRAQIIDLLTRIQKTRGLTYIFIAHNLDFVKSISHRVAIMYEGNIVEMDSTDLIFTKPSHYYTKKLLLSTSYDDLLR